MHLVPAPAVKLMKGRVLSRPGMKKCLGLGLSIKCYLGIAGCSSFIRDSRWSSIGLVSQPASNKEETEVAGGL